jgi:hypothetical protein
MSSALFSCSVIVSLRVSAPYPDPNSAIFLPVALDVDLESNWLPDLLESSLFDIVAGCSRVEKGDKVFSFG